MVQRERKRIAIRPRVTQSGCQSIATQDCVLEPQAGQHPRAFLANGLELVRIELERAKYRGRDLRRGHVLRDLPRPKIRVRDQERDVRIVERATAVLGDLLGAARVNDAPVGLNEDVGGSGRSQRIARGGVTERVASGLALLADRADGTMLVLVPTG